MKQPLEPSSLVFASVNTLDLSLEELNRFRESLLGTLPASVRVEVQGETPAGVGNTWVDVLLITVPTVTMMREKFFQIVTDEAVEFMRRRFQRRHEEKRTRLVCIYGPDGKILKKVQIDTAESDPRVDEDPSDDGTF